MCASYIHTAQPKRQYAFVHFFAISLAVCFCSFFFIFAVLSTLSADMCLSICRFYSLSSPHFVGCYNIFFLFSFHMLKTINATNAEQQTTSSIMGIYVVGNAKNSGCQLKCRHFFGQICMSEHIHALHMLSA